jgi:hypothetical protein
LECAGALVVWALALYVITRGGWRRIPVLAALTMAALATYQVGLGLSSIAPDGLTALAWLRYTWPGPALLPALWLALAAALAVEEGPESWRPRLGRWLTPVAVVAMVSGLAFATSAAGDLVRRWSIGLVQPEAPPGEALALRHAAPGPLYPLYAIYLVGAAALATAFLVLAWRSHASGTPLRSRFGWLVAASLLFLLGGAYLAVAAGEAALPGLPGQALLIAGMLVVGWSVARYGALVAGEVVVGDLLAFSASVAALVAFYAVVLYGLLQQAPFWPSQVVPLLLLAMITHVFVDRRTSLAGSHRLHRWLYGPVAGLLRARLRTLADRVVRQPDPQASLVEVRESVRALLREAAALEGIPESPAALDVTRASEAARPLSDLRVLVEGALRHVNDLPELSQHPLLARMDRASAAAGTALDRAARLRETLLEAISRLRPAGARPAAGTAAGPGGWLHYLVLHEAYVEGRPNKQIMQRYHLSEGTFHRARRRAIDALTLDLDQRWDGGPDAARAG